ncbi:ferrous iron transport protein A [Methanospirillum hungatei]|jgi:Fe2+ transport system protein FeoA|uniref:FeoA family protein n=1 Tax=Methanospirillum hungatei TaxID=2203 RepID=UPI0009CD9511|nr:ferrous iron transport protein A [Methanospirillum hungatei]MBP9007547.1 ferrous iron transport protein A [Methanospirillum sp.]OQA52414.1 MAG: ferrous iron transport protein A [Euryarchaeota archaeon ADurb.Bin294]HOW05843.1 ferrous iron transport protein A [Methanospirillum hungatei]
MSTITVEQLLPGTSGIISSIQGEPSIRRRLMEMGVLPGSELTLIKWAPLGDPAECSIRGYKLSLRRAEAALITVEPKKGK